MVAGNQSDSSATELRATGSLSAATRRRLARAAFAHTAAYDGAIVAWLDAESRSALVGHVHRGPARMVLDDPGLNAWIARVVPPAA